MCRGLQVVESKEETLQTRRLRWKIFRKEKIVHLVTKTKLMAMLGICTVACTLHFGSAGVSAAATVQECHRSMSPTRKIEAQADYRESSVWQEVEFTPAVSSSAFCGERWALTPPLSAQSDAVTYDIRFLPRADLPVQNAQLPRTGLRSARWSAAVHDIAPSSGKRLMKPERRVAFAEQLIQAGSQDAERDDMALMEPSQHASPAYSMYAAQGNAFPYGQCTWYANQRYHEMHGYFVPWRWNADAWQWKDRAHEYGWHVSSRPSVGAIMQLLGGVQGAGPFGHVGVVEKVLNNGSVVVSSMNWGVNPLAVSYWTFQSGPGVYFISRT
ncbi:CHAP domain-containing protein [Thermosporothrix hazakensis]|jgi:surface antigen|uniref:CHAP domain-containing protein n=1 Tax=Thermosporothrix hazakensis TaxID=644383 RepID=A0A326TSF2_THEHA|nr:CHAP domain-containing protein [Thermosporothrix hazakensis]